MPQHARFSLGELEEKMRAISRNWHEGSHQGNDGNPGNTLEMLLGIDENNLRIPDFGEIEIKAKQIERGGYITLVHDEPNPPASVPRIIKACGWRHKKAGHEYPADEMRFTSTTFSNRYTSRGFTLELTDSQIRFNLHPDKCDRNAKDRSGIFSNLGQWLDDIERRTPHYTSVLPVYWSLDEFFNERVAKLENTFLCLYKKRGRVSDNHVEYLFCEGSILNELSMSRFRQEFSSGALSMEFDARTRHNHGVKLRIKPKSIENLFARTRRIF